MYLGNTATFFLAATFSLTALVRAEAQTPSWAKVSPEQIAAAKKLGVPVAFENSLGMQFVLIPAGTFTMGSRDSAAQVAKSCNMSHAQPGWFHDEHPSHEVTLTNSFYMSIHEVTQAAFQAIEAIDPNKGKNRNRRNQRNPVEYPEGYQGKNHPVTKVSWEDAEKFLRLLSGSDKRQYTLPTEAQWEYACRAGTTTPFAFGETISVDQANYNGGYTYADGVKGVYRNKPIPVGSLSANAWGLYDMHGNVSELCSDRYNEYVKEAQTDPTGPAEGHQHIIRGGSSYSYPGACRSAIRLSGHRNIRSFNIGFRVCCPVSAAAEQSVGK